jgi:hypothetical protein
MHTPLKTHRTKAQQGWDAKSLMNATSKQATSERTPAAITVQEPETSPRTIHLLRHVQAFSQLASDAKRTPRSPNQHRIHESQEATSLGYSNTTLIPNKGMPTT